MKTYTRMITACYNTTWARRWKVTPNQAPCAKPINRRIFPWNLRVWGVGVFKRKQLKHQGRKHTWETMSWFSSVVPFRTAEEVTRITIRFRWQLLWRYWTNAYDCPFICRFVCRVSTFLKSILGAYCNCISWNADCRAVLSHRWQLFNGVKEILVGLILRDIDIFGGLLLHRKV